MFPRPRLLLLFEESLDDDRLNHIDQAIRKLSSSRCTFQPGIILSIVTRVIVEVLIRRKICILNLVCRASLETSKNSTSPNFVIAEQVASSHVEKRKGDVSFIHRTENTWIFGE